MFYQRLIDLLIITSLVSSTNQFDKQEAESQCKGKQCVGHGSIDCPKGCIFDEDWNCCTTISPQRPSDDDVVAGDDKFHQGLILPIVVIIIVCCMLTFCCIYLISKKIALKRRRFRRRQNMERDNSFLFNNEHDYTDLYLYPVVRTADDNYLSPVVRPADDNYLSPVVRPADDNYLSPVVRPADDNYLSPVVRPADDNYLSLVLGPVGDGSGDDYLTPAVRSVHGDGHRHLYNQCSLENVHSSESRHHAPVNLSMTNLICVSSRDKQRPFEQMRLEKFGHQKSKTQKCVSSFPERTIKCRQVLQLFDEEVDDSSSISSNEWSEDETLLKEIVRKSDTETGACPRDIQESPIPRNTETSDKMTIVHEHREKQLSCSTLGYDIPPAPVPMIINEGQTDVNQNCLVSVHNNDYDTPPARVRVAEEKKHELYTRRNFRPLRLHKSNDSRRKEQTREADTRIITRFGRRQLCLTPRDVTSNQNELF